MTTRIDQASFKAMSRGILIGLVIVVALVGYNIDIPKGRSFSRNWNFAFTHPTILLHVVIATAVVLAALILFVRSIRSHHLTWILESGVGLAFVLIAFASGEIYVATLSNGSLSAMGLSCFGAMVTFGAGWYLNRDSATPSTGITVPAGN